MNTIRNRRTAICCAIPILAVMVLTGCSKPTINGVALPEFYGLFAIDQGKLLPIMQNDTPDFSGGVQFLVFDKSVTFGVHAEFYSIGFDTEPHPADNGSFSWPKFMQSIEAYQRGVQASLTGIPESATRVQALEKPVEKKPEMVLFVPTPPLKPGLYQWQGVAKFWVERKSYQTTAEANAKQSLQAERWLDASRFASIALIVGPSDPSLKDDLTQIKFGALTKGARKAIQQQNFDLAKSFATRGNDLQPPSHYASEFRELLNVEIPYQEAIIAATRAVQNEEWDLVMRDGELALGLKPGDSKAQDILSNCPKVLLPSPPGVNMTRKIYGLQFSPDGKRLFTPMEWIDINGNGYDRKVKGWDVAERKEIKVTGGQLLGNCAFCLSPRGTVAVGHYWDGTYKKDLWLEDLLDSTKPKEEFNFDWLNADLTQFGFSEDGSILWTLLAGIAKGSATKLGLLSAAAELGFLQDLPFRGAAKDCVVLWDVKTATPITLIGYNTEYHAFTSIAVSSNRRTAVLYETASGDSGRNAIASRLSAWNIPNHRLLRATGVRDQNFSLWAIAADGKRAIVWLDGKFQQWNWEADRFESPVELPQGNHISCFSPNHKYIADRSTGDPYIRICEFGTGKVLHRFKEAAGENVIAMAFSPDGSYLATALARNADFLALWKIPSELRPLISMKSVTAVVNSATEADGNEKRAVSPGDVQRQSFSGEWNGEIPEHPQQPRRSSRHGRSDRSTRHRIGFEIWHFWHCGAPPSCPGC